MCQSKAEGGRRCLSHLSSEVSADFGAAYKKFSETTKAYKSADLATNSEENDLALTGAYWEAMEAVSNSGADDEVRLASRNALKATLADTLSSRHHKRVAAGYEPATGDAEQMANERAFARAQRAQAQENLQIALGHEPPTSPTSSVTGSVSAAKAAPTASATKAPAAASASPAGQPISGKVFTASTRTGWEPASLGQDWAHIPGLPNNTTELHHMTPGAQFTHDAGDQRHVTVKDRRGNGAPAVNIHPAALTEAVNAAGITGPANVEVRLSNKESVYGYARRKSDGTDQVVIAIKDKDSYPAAAGYVVNNSLVHELHHVAQRQQVSNFDEAYAAEAMKGYDNNKYEQAAWGVGRIADHTFTKSQPAGQAPKSGAVWAILPDKNTPTT